MKKVGFNSESELVNKLLATGGGLPALSKWDKLGSIVEFDNSFGRADVVFYNLRKNWESRLQLGKVNPRWAYLLRELPYRKKFTTEKFVSLTGLSQARCLEALQEFVDLKYLKKTASGDWQKVIQPKLVVIDIIAIEAKLRNWRGALKQAYRYLDYANESWVVMDAALVTPALKRVELFQKYNIGLASLDLDGSISIHYQPKKSKPYNVSEHWQANAKIAASIH